MTRQRKTPRQRAEEALAVAERKVERLTAERDKYSKATDALQVQLQQAIRRRDYLTQNPDLPQQPSQPEEKKK